jgi:hypothetical protein
MERHCKHAFPTIERLYFLRGRCKVGIKKSSFEKSSRVESSRVSRRLSARRRAWSREIELSWKLQNNGKKCGRETSCVISSDSETVINPLPGYD